MGESGDIWLDYVTAIGTLLASLGALAAVGVTLYLNVWRERRRQPSLTLELTPEADVGAGYELAEAKGPTVLAPINVSNAPGKKSAHRVEVLLSAGYWLGLTGTEELQDFAKYRQFHEIVNQDPLTWWVSDPPKGEGQQTSEIPPGVTRKAALLHSGHPQSLYESMPPHEPWSSISPTTLPYLEASFGIFPVVPLTQGTAVWLDNQLAYEIRLTVVAEDIDAVFYRTRLRWIGPTPEEMEDPPEFIEIHPQWDPLERIEAESWPGPAPKDNPGWVPYD